MATTETTRVTTEEAEGLRNDQAVNLADRDSYFEHLASMKADNRKLSAALRLQTSACFESWALPDYMRH
ncbi:hypothetical protein JJB09_08220 [Rhizobium sp. KVB221]|uniref:Uncharacterized protein n=1 Tax=Rhizobium setariae TaxID=2801340 RepID=A0A936YPF5_9HYPH|nr:hypothetical protein [Rhizobium setariae]MBL0372011.1 hypothetical protein [Rhizobium setariae]